MVKFETNRVIFNQIKSSFFKCPIPISIIKPKRIIKNTCIFLFNAGMNGSISNILYMNNKFYDHHFLVSYDKLGHGNNKNKPSQHKNKYLIELDEVTKWIKKNYPKNDIYLLGESWGSAINLIYYKKQMKQKNNLIKGLIVWNMPTKPINPEKLSFKTMFNIAWREIFSFLFHIPFYLPIVQKDYAKLSQNIILVRAKKMQNNIKNHSFITLACWRYMRPSKKFLLKNGKNSNFNFLYIQTGQDALVEKKMLPIFNSKMDSKHYIFMPTGYHILSMEPIESEKLYKIIDDFIQR